MVMLADQKPRRLRIRCPDDWHLHLRQGELLRQVAPLAGHFGRALVMPNTDPPLLTAADALRYRDQVAAAAPRLTPLMSIKLTARVTPQDIASAAAVGVVAAKLYPAGVTTNSADGVSDFGALRPVLEAMAESGLVLCVHGELPGAPCLEREQRFLPILAQMAAEHPRLRIVLEHISTASAAEYILRQAPANVAVTITPHHLALTIDDLLGDMLGPHNFCKPLTKTAADRAALVRAATSGHPRVFLGTDSAPHPRAVKEAAAAAAGIFSSPVALPLLAQIFETAGALGRLEAFTSEYGAAFYGQPLNDGYLELHRRTWRVPESYGEVVPLWAGQQLDWSVIS